MYGHSFLLLPIIENVSLLHCIFLASLPNVRWLYVCALIFESFLYFTNPHLCHCISAMLFLIKITPYYVLKLAISMLKKFNIVLSFFFCWCCCWDPCMHACMCVYCLLSIVLGTKVFCTSIWISGFFFCLCEECHEHFH